MQTELKMITPFKNYSCSKGNVVLFLFASADVMVVGLSAHALESETDSNGVTQIGYLFHRLGNAQ